MEGMVKGYMIVATGRFIMGDAAIRARVSPALLDEIAKHEKTIKPSEWIGRPDQMVLWRAIAAGSDDATAYGDLVRCGESIADYASGTFLRLLLKMLTPGLFARKFPDLWAHDHRGGFIENDKIDAKGMQITIKDIEGFDHIGGVAPGFIRFALTAIGLKNIVTRSPNWSMTTPAPRDATIVVSWD